MIPILQGLESSDHQKTLLSVREDLFEEPPAIAVGVSFKSMRARRQGPAYIERLAENFTVVMEAGVSGSPLSAEDAQSFAADYYEFVSKVPEITYAVEFDHPAVRVAPEEADTRIIPVVDPEDGAEALQTALDEFGQIAMAPNGNKALTPVLRRSDGLAVSLGEQDLAAMQTAGFGASMIQAWLYPAKYGELIVWDGSRFHRHNPGTFEDRQRLVGKYERVLSGSVDMDLILRREAREVTRAAAFAYLSWGQSLARDLPTSTEDEGEDAKVVHLASTHTLPRGVKKVRVPQALPLFGQDEVSALEEGEDGATAIRSRRVLKTSDETIRVCDTCVLASTCPAYEAGSSCAFNMPVEVRTPSQVKAVLHSMMELQATRVAFARFAEEIRGGDIDPAVGQEMDRLFRMAERLGKVDERRERLTVTMESEESGGGTGVLSRIFGPRAQPPAIDADVVVEQIETSTQ